MDIFKQFATDPNLELKGRWVRIGGTEEKPSRVLVARTGTPRYNAIMSLQFEAHKTLMEGKDTVAANAKLQEMIVHALATCVLLGWENVTYKGDSTYNYANASAMLQHRDFRKVVEDEANKFAAYKLHNDEEDAKNSSPA